MTKVDYIHLFKEACGGRCNAEYNPCAFRQAVDSLAALEPVAWDCCANCLRPKSEHRGEECPRPYTTVWHAWDYEFPPDNYTTPPRKEWIGLTDGEINIVLQQFDRDSSFDDIASAIEAKLKEKNT